jgi:quinolinate synthase
MAKTSLEDLLDACEKEQFTVKIPEDIRVRAEKALQRMLEL